MRAAGRRGRRPTSDCSTARARPTGCTPTRGGCCASRPSSSKGFGALAELGPAVAVFGSARTAAEHPSYAIGERARRAQLVEAGFAVITGGGPGAMEAANKGASEAGGRQRRARHRAALRVRPQRVGRHRHQLPLLLRPQDDVRQVRPGLRRAARRLRHPRRAVRGADARADPARSPASRSCCSARRLLERAGRLAARHGPPDGQDQPAATSTCSRSPTTSTRPSPPSWRPTPRAAASAACAARRAPRPPPSPLRRGPSRRSPPP